MKTEPPSRITETNTSSHINHTPPPANVGSDANPESANRSAATQTSSVHPSINPPTSGPAAFLPPGIRDRKFRACSFMWKLNDMQRSVLSAWLCHEDYSIEDIRKKVAASPPNGFGMAVQSTTLRRLRQLAENVDAIIWVSDAMDTACDLLDEEEASETAPLRQALTALLYSRALHAAQKQAMPEIIDKLVTTIERLERLATRGEKRDRAFRPISPRRTPSPLDTASNFPSSPLLLPRRPLPKSSRSQPLRLTTHVALRRISSGGLSRTPRLASKPVRMVAPLTMTRAKNIGRMAK
jgi:hypothetical protein